jgi:hypothetical protein
MDNVSSAALAGDLLAKNCVNRPIAGHIRFAKLSSDAPPVPQKLALFWQEGTMDKPGTESCDRRRRNSIVDLTPYGET